MIEQIKNKVKELASWYSVKKEAKKKGKKVYCKNCIYYIKFMPNPSGTSEHICGHYLSTELNAIGDVVFKKYGHHEQCPKCKTTLHDDRKVITRSCLDINSDNKCMLFKDKKSIINVLKKIFNKVS